MRPIPAPRLGDSHGLLRAIDRRERLRLDEFMTEFSVDELYPPGLENAIGRTRQFVSFARAAGLVREDRGMAELTETGRRYIRAGDPARPYDVGPGQAEWLRRLLREQHMTDTIYHGLAIALSLLASSPGAEVATLDFGRALNHLGRAGWDNENTLEIQGERHLTLLRDMELIDAGRALTATGTDVKRELTLPVHMSLVDLVGQLSPPGVETRGDRVEAVETVEEVVEAAPTGGDEVEAVAAQPRATLLPGSAIRAAAVDRGLQIAASTFANLAAALAHRHVLIVGPPASGKTELALAVAAAAGRGTTLVVGGAEPDVIAAARAGRWLVIDDLTGAPAPSALLAGLPVTVGGAEITAPGDWRIVATAAHAPDGLGSRFAVVEIGEHPDLERAIDAAAGDAVAAAAARRLLGIREIAPLGAGVFLAAAAHAAARRAEVPADDATLTRELFTAYVAPLLDGDTAARAREHIS